jgi:hypothetical protein
MLWCLRLIGVGAGRFDGINRNYWQREQLAGAGDGRRPMEAAQREKLGSVSLASIATRMPLGPHQRT